MKKELTRQQYLDLYYYMRLNRAVEDMPSELLLRRLLKRGLLAKTTWPARFQSRPSQPSRTTARLYHRPMSPNRCLVGVRS